MIIRKNKILATLLKITGILLIIQFTRILMTEILFLFIAKTSLIYDTAEMLIMCFLTAIIILISVRENIKLSFKPAFNNRKSRIIYFLISVLIGLLIISSPCFIQNFSVDVIVPIIYLTVVTPMFEELIFRGYIWNKLAMCVKSEFLVYISITILFACWHLGYIDTIYFKLSLRGEAAALPFAMLMKVITGLCYGLVIGLVRYKFKNCYASMLVHSVINIFGR